MHDLLSLSLIQNTGTVTMTECPHKQETKADLALELAKQTYRFGPMLNLQATWAASLALPWGLAAAGAAATRTFVDAGDVKGALALGSHDDLFMGGERNSDLNSHFTFSPNAHYMSEYGRNCKVYCPHGKDWNAQSGARHCCQPLSAGQGGCCCAGTSAWPHINSPYHKLQF